VSGNRSLAHEGNEGAEPKWERPTKRSWRRGGGKTLLPGQLVVTWRKKADLTINDDGVTQGVNGAYR